MCPKLSLRKCFLLSGQAFNRPSLALTDTSILVATDYRLAINLDFNFLVCSDDHWSAGRPPVC